MQPGLWVTSSGGRNSMATAWGWTPQARRRHLAGANVDDRVAEVGAVEAGNADAAGSPMCTGAVGLGNRLVT